MITIKRNESVELTQSELQPIFNKVIAAFGGNTSKQSIKIISVCIGGGRPDGSYGECGPVITKTHGEQWPLNIKVEITNDITPNVQN